MSRTLSEAIQLRSVPETALGTADTTGWRTHQPNGISAFGAQFRSVMRDPLGAGRQKQKGDVVGLDAAATWNTDTTKDVIDHFDEGIMMAARKHNGGTGVSRFLPTSITASGLVVPSGGALPANTLIAIKGSRIAGNNGLKVSTGNAAALIGITGLTAETINYPAGQVIAEVAGIRAPSGVVGLDASGNLTFTAGLDATTLGLVPNQWIRIGGDAVANSFANTAYKGFAQIVSITAGLITLRRRSWTVGALDAGTGKLIDIYYGRWIRNTNAQDADYLERSYTFEMTYQTLNATGLPMYEYNYGCYCAQAAFTFPPGDKATCELSFIGQGSIDPVEIASRKAGAVNAPNPIGRAMFTTHVTMQRIRMTNADESGLSTDIKNLTLTFNNAVTGEEVLGYFGKKYLNVGDFSVELSGDFLFSNADMIAGCRDKRSVMIEVAIRNGDGGYLFDLPAATLMTVDRDFTPNESIKLRSSISGFEDPIYGYSASIATFPYLPAS